MIYIGTSGYYYKDWIGTVYPDSTNQKKMFEAYTEKALNAVELNFSYYRLPSATMLKNFSKKAPDDFRYIIKAYKGITHTYNDIDTVKTFADNYREGNVNNNFGGILLQFPESFHKNSENTDSLLERTEPLKNIPLFIEFRGSDWNKTEVYDTLREHNLNYVTVDLPDKKNLHNRVIAKTGPLGYFRFHGRNKNWYDADDRYNYNYSDGELNIFSKEIKNSSEDFDDVYIFFNNCHGGFALKNALSLKDKLQ